MRVLILVVLLGSAYKAVQASDGADSNGCTLLNRFPAEEVGKCGECFDGFTSGTPNGKCVFNASTVFPTYQQVRGTIGNPFREMDWEKIETTFRFNLSPAFADLKKQNFDDAYVTENTMGQVFMFKSDGEGNLEMVDESPFKGVQVIGPVVFADFNNDTWIDAAFVDLGKRFKMRMWFNDGQGNLVKTAIDEEKNFFQGFEGVTVSNFGTVDADEDGDLDLFLVGVEGAYYYAENQGTAMSPRFVMRQLEEDVPFFELQTDDVYGTVAFEDVNGDGRKDLMYGKQTGEILFFKNLGKGQFQRSQATANPLGHLQTCLLVEPNLGGPSCGGHVSFGKLREDGARDAYVGRLGKPNDYAIDRYANLGTKGHDNFWQADFYSSRFAQVDKYIKSVFDEDKVARLSTGFREGRRANIAFWPLDDTRIGVREGFVGLYDGTVHHFSLLNQTDKFFTPMGQVAEMEQPDLWTSVAVDLEDKILYTGFNGEFRAFRRKQDGSFEQLDQNENPLGSVKTSPGNNVIFARVDDAGLRAFVNSQRSMFECFLKGDDGMFSKCGDDPLRTLRPRRIREWSSMAFVDLDSDGDLDLVLGMEFGTFQIAYNTGTSSTPEFTAFEESRQLDIVDVSAFLFIRFEDIDGDGDMDMIVGKQSGRIVEWMNTASECATACIGGRGVCAQSTDDPVADEVISQVVAAFQKRQGENVGGLCSCEPQFAGSACEVCAKGRIGKDCEETCPRFSTTRDQEDLIRSGFRRAYPFVTTQEDCVCDATFVADPAANEGTLDCVCPPGWAFNEEFLVCQECSIGTFKTNASLSHCVECGSNSLSKIFFTTAITGASSEESCICKDTFTLVDGECTCPPGWGFNPTFLVCEPCPQGTFKSTFLRESCLPCGGTHSHEETHFTTQLPGATSQDICVCKESFVQIQTLENQTACVCPPGFGYDPLVKVCEVCPSGRFSASADLSECQVCEEGTTTFRSGMAQCEPVLCPLGKERDPKTLECSPCGTGWFRDANSLACQQCPSTRPLTKTNGTVSIDGCLAQVGSFVMEGQVLSCSDTEFAGKLACRNAGLTLETLCLNPGWWRIGPKSTDIRQCPEPNFCQGQVDGCSAGTDSRSLSTEQDKEWNPYCSPHHTGILCMSCEDGYASSGSSPCETCTEERKDTHSSLFIAWIFIGLILVLLPSVVVIITSSMDSSANPSAEKKTCWSRFVASAEEIGTSFVILIGFLQVYWQFVQQNNLFESSSAESVFFFLFNLDLSAILGVISFDCVQETNFYTTLLVSTVWPLIAVVLILLTGLVLNKCCFGETAVNASLWVLFQLLFLIYPRVSAIILSTFVYDEIYYDDSTPAYRALKADYRVNYDDDQSQFWRIYAGVMTAVYPVFILFLFLFSAIWSAAQAKRTPMNFLIHRYKPTTPWFESLELFRKLILTGCFVLVSQVSRDAGNLFYVGFCAFGLFVFYRLDPYAKELDSYFAEVCMLLLFALGFVPLAFSQDIASRNSVSALAITVAVLALIAFCVHLALSIRGHWKKDKQTAAQSSSKIILDAQDKKMSQENANSASESHVNMA